MQRASIQMGPQYKWEDRFTSFSATLPRYTGDQLNYLLVVFTNNESLKYQLL